MKVGVPREVKDNEYRVALTPAGVRELAGHGHVIYVEKSAGVGSSFEDGFSMGSSRLNRIAILTNGFNIAGLRQHPAD